MRSETGGIQEVAVQPVGLQPPPRLTPFLSMLTVKTEPVYPRAVEAVTEVLAVRSLDRIGKGLEHRVACGQSKRPAHWCE